MATLEDYTDLVTSEHQGKLNFLAMLGVVLQPFVDGINVLESMPSRFDVDSASGEQLDFVGEWVGLSRSLRTPIAGVYFAFDTPGLGFDEGVWFSPGDPAEGVISLDDVTYLLMIKAKIAANSWDGSLGQANSLLLGVFTGADVVVQDNFDMTQTFIISGSPPSVLFEQLVDQGYIPFKPATVGLTP